MEIGKALGNSDADSSILGKFEEEALKRAAASASGLSKIVAQCATRAFLARLSGRQRRNQIPQPPAHS
jgi:hypothetical protein